MHRAFSSPYLCDLTVPRIGVQCVRCGMVRSYDRLKLFSRLKHIDDQCLPSLLKRLAKAEGRERVREGNYSDLCALIYDEASRPG